MLRVVGGMNYQLDSFERLVGKASDDGSEVLSFEDGGDGMGR